MRGEQSGPGRNSCAYCLLSGKVSGVLGGMNRRYDRAVVTTGGSSGDRAICRVTSLVCRLAMVVMGLNVPLRSILTRLRGEDRGAKGLGGFRIISGGSWLGIRAGEPCSFNRETWRCMCVVFVRWRGRV